MKVLRRTLLLLCVAFLFHGCDLELQRSFDFDESDKPPAQEPFQITIYEYMTQNPDLFSLMVEAIERAEMENVFNGGEDDKTVLLLRNEAMQRFLNDYGFDSIAEVPVTTLQNLLKYHVVTTRLSQEDLPVQQFIVYETLIEGEDGLINVWKWRRLWEIRFNNGGPNLPNTAKGAAVWFHNFEFTNGIGHQMTRYVQRVPF